MATHGVGVRGTVQVTVMATWFTIFAITVEALFMVGRWFGAGLIEART